MLGTVVLFASILMAEWLRTPNFDLKQRQWIELNGERNEEKVDYVTKTEQRIPQERQNAPGFEGRGIEGGVNIRESQTKHAKRSDEGQTTS